LTERRRQKAMVNLEEAKRRLAEALARGEISKEVHDQVLQEVKNKCNEEMFKHARRLAQLDSKPVPPPPPVEKRTGKTGLHYWLALGVVGVAAVLARQFFISGRPEATPKRMDKPAESKPARKRKTKPR